MMEVVIGTYEELILAYKIIPDEKNYQFELSFTDHSHTGSIRAVATSKRGILASGSSDELIRIFNLKKHFEIGSLMHHNGMITNLTFHGKTHMFSTSNDGSIGVWQVGKWECLRTLRGHKGAVLCSSVHPTGRMALSVGQDKTLRIWNLMTGKCAYITALKQAADIVQWSPDGSVYIVVTNNRLDVYDVQTAKVKHSIQMAGRIQSVKFIDADIAILGGDQGKVEIHNITEMSQVHKFSTDTNRVKALDWCRCPLNSDVLLVTASSDGYIKIWRLHQEGTSWTHTEVGQTQTTFRPTCASLYQASSKQEQKPSKHKVKVETEEAEDEDVTSEEEDEEEEKPRKRKQKAKKRQAKVEELTVKKKRKKELDDGQSAKESPEKIKKNPLPISKKSAKSKSIKASKLSTSKAPKSGPSHHAAKNKTAKFKQRKKHSK